MKVRVTYNPTPETKLLRHEEVEILTDTPLMTRDEARDRFGLNAAVIAEIELPTPNHKGENKIIQLIDFGEDMPDEGRALVYMSEQGELRGAGVSKSRFALHGANFTPDDHAISYWELPNGSSDTIGRLVHSTPSRWLGVSDDLNSPIKNQLNRQLSREHFTVTITEDERVFIKDHSTNGTDVYGILKY